MMKKEEKKEYFFHSSRIEYQDGEPFSFTLSLRGVRRREKKLFTHIAHVAVGGGGGGYNMHIRSRVVWYVCCLVDVVFFYAPGPASLSRIFYFPSFWSDGIRTCWSAVSSVSGVRHRVTHTHTTTVR